MPKLTKFDSVSLQANKILIIVLNMGIWKTGNPEMEME